jgi:uncharacterized protein YnzC (UPF0291/DUF896 family)
VTSDDLRRRAWATLGVNEGTSERALRRQYLSLVRRWHPDRFANDPAGQAVANEKLRQIIQAYELLSAAPRHPSMPPPPATHTREPTRAPYGRLSREEIDGIIHSVGNVGPVDAFLDLAERSWPLFVAAGLVASLLGASGPSPSRLALALGVVVVAGVVWWRRRP